MTSEDLQLALVIYMDETFGDSVAKRISYLEGMEEAILILLDEEERKI